MKNKTREAKIEELVERILNLSQGQFEIVLEICSQDELIAFKSGQISTEQIKSISYKAV